MGYSRSNTDKRVKEAYAAVKDFEVRTLVRETDLSSLPLNTGYLVDGVHIYMDIPNAMDLLRSDQSEGERSHKRCLLFLHMVQRVIHFAFEKTNAVKVDFQNQRLHFIVYRPFGDRRGQLVHSIAISHGLLQLVDRGNDFHEDLEDAQISIGIEAGLSLAVSNGTRGHREPLFLGNPANHAAKVSAGKSKGIYLGAEAAKALGIAVPAGASGLKLNKSQLDSFWDEADLRLDLEKLAKTWAEERNSMRLADFEFSRPTPPLNGLDLDTLTPKNSRRLTAVSIFADLDGFTRFVAGRTGDLAKLAEAARILHVVRKELRDVLNDFGGLKIRYVGDCLHGVLAEGTSSTDEAESLRTATLCAGAMRTAMEVIKEVIQEAKGLGLAIGIDIGPISITRLGCKNDRTVVAVGRTVYESEEQQSGCTGAQTAYGPTSAKVFNEIAVRKLDPSNRIADMDYNKADALVGNGKRETESNGSGSPFGAIYPKAHCKPWGER